MTIILGRNDAHQQQTVARVGRSPVSYTSREVVTAFDVESIGIIRHRQSHTCRLSTVAVYNPIYSMPPWPSPAHRLLASNHLGKHLLHPQLTSPDFLQLLLQPLYFRFILGVQVYLLPSAWWRGAIAVYLG
jgi:hypothetical protein